MSLIDEIRENAKNGTPGRWDWFGGDGPTSPHATSNLGIWSEHRLNEAYENECEDPDDEKWLAGIWGEIDGEDCANAARIASVPRMEAALLAAERLITAADKMVNHEDWGRYNYMESEKIFHDGEDVKRAIAELLEAIK